MRFNARKFLALVAFVGLAATSTGAFAQATRTWVSGVGDDANPCSRTAPCKTFAGAISKTAARGLINVLDPGGFGGVTITKAITIDGGGISHGGILVSGTNGIVINAGATDDVQIRNLNIIGTGTVDQNGIRFLSGKSLHVTNVEIQGFEGRGIDFRPTSTSRLFIRDSYIHNNGNTADAFSGGIAITPGATASTNASIVGSQISDNNGTGLRVDTRSVVSLRDTVVDGNFTFGISAVATSDFAIVSASDCDFSGNGFAAMAGHSGVLSQGAAADVQLSTSTISHNDTGLRSVSGGAIRSYGNNRVFDNDVDGAPTATINEL